MKTCYILIGVPASGKSTWSSNNFGNSVITASSDNNIECVAQSYGFTYSETFKDLIAFATKVFERDLQYAIDYNENIVIDRTNVSPKVRKRFIDMFKKSDYKVIAVYFPTPKIDEWERRLKSRPGKFIPQDVLNSMATNLVEPGLHEGFDEIIQGELHEKST